MSNAAKQGAPRDLALVAACAHPVAIGAALLIFANDFGLRRVSPGWWSGKLSDVGWLVITPILLAAGLGLLRVPPKRAREAALSASIAVYLVMQLWPPLGAWFNPMHVADVEDLVVLPAVGLALLAWRGRETAPSRTSLAVAVPFLGAALVATTPIVRPPSQSWPCGDDMTWETGVPLRFRMVWPSQNIDSDAFVRAVRLRDGNGTLLPVFVAFAEREPRYAICARDGLLPNSAYTLQLGPWMGQESNEAPTREDALPKVYFITTDAPGVSVATASECSDRARQLTSEEYGACNQPTGGDTSETGTADTGEDETGASETGDESGDFDSGGDSAEPPPDSGEDTAQGEEP